MKKKYITPEMWITPIEAISALAHLSGYAIHNGDPYDEQPENGDIIPIEEQEWPGDDWGDDWPDDPFLDLD